MNSKQQSLYKSLTVIYCICLAAWPSTRNIKKSNSTTKRILLWNSYFDDLTWGLPNVYVQENFFRIKNCPETRCTISAHTMNIQALSKFDAILFHAASVPNSFGNPIERSPNQLYIFVSNESPVLLDDQAFKENNFFNLTITYRLDSDIVTAYGQIQEIKTRNVIAPMERPAWKKPKKLIHLNPEIEQMIAGKTKMAAWFVSNCQTPSMRLHLAQELAKHIPVDIYGMCGNLTCAKNSPECDEKLNKNYKFYFAFENSLCRDYVTEKLFRALQLNILPIVFGGADYTMFAPTHSYINANDYNTVEELANYLIYLDKNPQEYRKYFWWKKYYRVALPSSDELFCKLCAKLNNPAFSGKVKYYSNIKEWFSMRKCYVRSTIFF